MSALKSIVRWFFGLQALILILMPAVGIYGILTMRSRVHTAPVVSPHLPPNLSTITGGFMLGAALVVAIGAVFAMAWWTARKPSATRNLWAIAASLLYLAEGIVSVYVRKHINPSHFGLDLIAVGAVGLFVFFRSEDVPDPAIASRKRIPIAGDRTSVWTRHTVTALAVFAQIAAIFVWGRWAYTHELLRSHGLTWFALIGLTSVLTTIIHECGHALIAWCFEMGLLSFKAGPFQWAKREGKWKFKFHPASLLTAGGAVGAVPTTPDQPRWEEMLVIAAGPLANLLFGIPAIWAVQHDNWAHYQQTWEFVAFTGSFCLIAAVLNLFPFMSEEGSYSDGARILQIVTHSPLDDYHRTMASIASTVITARRYRDLDVAAIERAASLFPQEFRELHLHLCACHFYEDSGRLPEAAASLAKAEAIYNNVSVDLPGPLHTIFVIGHAYLNRDAASARLWWDRMEAKKRERSNVDYWLAKTALHWIEGNRKEAEEAWQKADLEAQALPKFGAYEFDRFRCAMLREVLNNPSQTLATSATSEPVVSRIPAARGNGAQPEPTRFPLAADIAAPVTQPSAVQLPQGSIATAAVLFDPLARIIPVSPARIPASTSATAAERSPMIGVIAPSPVKIAAPIAAPAIAPVGVASVATGPVSTGAFAEAMPVPIEAIRSSASFTRIPASSIVVAEAPFARISLLPAASSGSETRTAESTGLPSSSKAPAVPAAFARRPVRPVPAPPSDLYAEFADDATAVSPDFTVPAVKALDEATPVIAALLTPVPTVLTPTPPVPITTPSAARFDPLEFIRAAALENLPT